MPQILAGELGFEPRQAESESAVLPLDDSPTAELLSPRVVIRCLDPRVVPCKAKFGRSSGDVLGSFEVEGSLRAQWRLVALAAARVATPSGRHRHGVGRARRRRLMGPMSDGAGRMGSLRIGLLGVASGGPVSSVMPCVVGYAGRRQLGRMFASQSTPANLCLPVFAPLC
jgi:hypothetical protein